MKIKRIIENKYKVVEDGFMSQPDINEGKLLPAIILKSDKNDNRVKEYINIHDDIGSGDTETYWSYPISNYFGIKKIALNINVIRPVSFNFQIEFDIRERKSVLQSIFVARGVYIGLGEIGDKVSKVLPNLIIEIPSTNFDLKWDKLYREEIKKELKKSGISKKDLPKAIEDHLKFTKLFLNEKRNITS